MLPCQAPVILGTMKIFTHNDSHSPLLSSAAPTIQIQCVVWPEIMNIQPCWPLYTTQAHTTRTVSTLFFLCFINVSQIGQITFDHPLFNQNITNEKKTNQNESTINSTTLITENSSAVANSLSFMRRPHDMVLACRREHWILGGTASPSHESI